MRQCGDEVLRLFVTGAPDVRGGGGIPHRIIVTSRPPSVLRTTGAGWVSIRKEELTPLKVRVDWKSVLIS
jgi:hypothetical protein